MEAVLATGAVHEEQLGDSGAVDAFFGTSVIPTQLSAWPVSLKGGSGVYAVLVVQRQQLLPLAPRERWAVEAVARRIGLAAARARAP